MNSIIEFFSRYRIRAWERLVQADIEARRTELSFWQNIAAISAEFHTHRLEPEFYETFSRRIDGFTGQYEFCIEMARALTDWETSCGGQAAYDTFGVSWIDVVDDFVETVLEQATVTGKLTDPAKVLPTIQTLSHLR